MASSSEGDVLTKTCPACAETIQAAALVCKHCGYDYTTHSVGGAHVAQQTNGFAIAALVLGIVWIYWIGSILAVVFGHVALSQIKKSDGLQRGGGLAIAGLVLGYVGLALLVIFVVLIFIGTAVETR